MVHHSSGIEPDPLGMYRFSSLVHLHRMTEKLGIYLTKAELDILEDCLSNAIHESTLYEQQEDITLLLDKIIAERKDWP